MPVNPPSGADPIPIKACVFDAYGTLFDVAAAARNAAAEPGGEALAEVWPRLAETWRLKQLEYSWLRAVADDYVPFWQVTQDGLDYALDMHGLADAGLRDTLLGLYRRLDAYAEVPEALRALKDAGYATAILSNGSPDMLDAAIDSAGLRDLLDDSISVADVGVFKPHRSVYELAEARMGAKGSEIAFFSSNGWDAAHAARHGFATTWVNRSGLPVDRVGAKPAKIVRSLDGCADLVAGYA
jgi:2-haloacid dehalogenase